MSLRIKFLFVSVAVVFLFSGTSFSAVDGEGNYYISDKWPSGTADGNIQEWRITIEYLALIKTDGTVVELLTSPVTKNLLSEDAGSISAYFATGASIPTGSYKQVRIQQGATTTMKGWIDEAGTFYTTRDGTPNYLNTAASEAQAEAFAETITIEHGGGVTDDVPENPNLDEPVVVEDGKSYTLKILWYAVGLESGNGVGLVWDVDNTEFIEGMLCEQYSMVDSDGAEQFFQSL